MAEMINHPPKRLAVNIGGPAAGQGGNARNIGLGGERATPIANDGGDWSFPSAVKAASDSASNVGQILTPEQRVAIDTAEPLAALNSAAKSLTEFNKPDAECDADFYSVKLPSDFAFYSFKELSVKKVTGRVQAKFNRAAAESQVRYVVEGMSSLLGDGVSAFDLSAQDFRWLMYWVLLASYPTSARRVAVECTNQAHIDKVHEGILPESSLRYIATYNRPILEEVLLDHAELKALDLSSLSHVTLGVYTMRDSVDWEENYSERSNGEDSYIYDLAVYLKNGTLEERAELVRDMNVTQLRALEAYRDVASKHGVLASMKHTCKECGAETVTKITVSAHDFL